MGGKPLRVVAFLLALTVAVVWDETNLTMRTTAGKARRQTNMILASNSTLGLECKKRSSLSDNDNRGPPRPDFEGRIVYFSMGSSNYIEGLHVFVESLVSLGVKKADIGIVCIDHNCADHFESKYPETMVERYVDQVEGSNCLKDHKVSETRCRVSMGKIHAILEHLRMGEAVYFFDADVVFYQHPYDSMRVEYPNLNLYVQSNQAPSPKDVNFGLFLAYPSPMTISLFAHLKQEFDKTQAWDQQLFNFWLFIVKNQKIGQDSICGDPYDFEILPMDEYVNLMLTNSYSVDKQKHTAVHATCIEGGHAKFFVVHSMFGGTGSGYYTNQKTVAVDGDVDWKHRKQTERVMRALVHVARSKNRAIRVPISTKRQFLDPAQPFRVVSAEYLTGTMKVNLVEQEYWHRALAKHNRVPKVAKINLGHSPETATSRLIDGGVVGDEHNDADELLFSLDELLSLPDEKEGELSADDGGYKDGVWERSILCRLHNQETGCLRVCDRGHFRRS